jgi:hypothetical protein
MEIRMNETSESDRTKIERAVEMFHEAIKASSDSTVLLGHALVEALKPYGDKPIVQAFALVTELQANYRKMNLTEEEMIVTEAALRIIANDFLSFAEDQQKKRIRHRGH